MFKLGGTRPLVNLFHHVNALNIERLTTVRRFGRNLFDEYQMIVPMATCSSDHETKCSIVQIKDTTDDNINAIIKHHMPNVILTFNTKTKNTIKKITNVLVSNVHSY